jgi:DNA-binding MarR family transcriptional regulator
MGEGLRKRIQQDKFESPVNEAVFNLVVAADHVRAKTDEVCGEFGISASQYNVLRILRGAHPDGHPRREIARRMLERAPDITRLIDRLEAQGLAARGGSQADRRLSISRITQKGLLLLERMEPGIRELNGYFSERISRRDRRELSRICEGIYGEDSDF